MNFLSRSVAAAVVCLLTTGCGSGDGDGSPTVYDNTCDPLPPAYNVEIQVTSGGRIGALQLDITHLGRSGCFIGRGADVECEPLVDALIAANYRLDRTTSVGLISLPG